MKDHKSFTIFRSIYLTMISLITGLCIIVGCSRFVTKPVSHSVKKNDKSYDKVEKTTPTNSGSSEIAVSGTKYTLPAFSSLNIQSDMDNIEIKAGEESSLFYKKGKNINSWVEFSVSDDTLNIISRVEDEDRLNLNSIKKESGKITVTVPSSIDIKSLDISISMGNTEIEDIKKGGTAVISSDMGNITIKDGAFHSINASSSMGNIKLDDVVIEAESFVSSDMGNITVDLDMNISDISLDLLTDLGNIKIDGKKYHGSYISGSKDGIPLHASTNMGNVIVDGD